MTQPWVQDLLDRYLGDEKNRFKRPQVPRVPIERPEFDPSSYYGDLGFLQNISRAGTAVVRQRVANQREIERQQELAEMRRLAQQQIDLSGITPQFTAPKGPKGKYGTKKGRYGSPLRNYSLTSGYGPRRAPTAGASSYHRGIDMAAPSGTPIYATHNGYVDFSGWSSGYGYNITLNAGNGVQTFYGHQSKLAVKSGQYVQKGQLIGYVGSTGISTGPHLHYGVKVNGNWVNPQGYY